MMRRVRTTLSLDEDVLSVARAVAAAERVSLMTSTASTARVAEGELPFFKVPADAPPITPEMVRRALDEE